MLGRYALYGQIAAGGMASVHFARVEGFAGFERTVAIKRLHPHLARDPEFVSMFVDEARLAARVSHPNVASTLDVVSHEDELFVVMEYVHGESLARLWRTAIADPSSIPLPVILAIMTGALAGLHAAHEARNKLGEPLGIVHRDISPHNILVGKDGIARIIDFGVAKAKDRLHATQDGKVKGKLAYMALEQLRGGLVDRRSDIYSMGVVLWELLARSRLFAGDNDAMTITNILERHIAPPSKSAPGVPATLDRVTLRALAREPAKRFETASQMATALEASGPIASPARVGEWVEAMAGDGLARRAEALARIEAESGVRVREAVEVEAAPLADASQVSSMSVSGPAKLEPPRARARWFAGLAIGSILLVSGALWHFRSAEPSTPAAPVVAIPAIEPAVPESAPVAAPVPPSSTPSPATRSGTAAPSFAPQKRASDPARGPVRKPSASSETIPRPRCEPPFTIDPDGVRHYKPECPLN
jgi:hypothetical protein